MQKIVFGYDNSIYPNGGQEGIGINKELFLTDADYYGAIKFEGDHFVVTKVTEDKYNRYPQLLGNFIVMPAIADMYSDGSGNIFLNQEQSMIAKSIEKYLNESDFKDKFTSISEIIRVFNGRIHPADRTFDFLTDERFCGDHISATSIIPEVFEKKNEALKHCHQSFSEIASALNEFSNSRTY